MNLAVCVPKVRYLFVCLFVCDQIFSFFAGTKEISGSDATGIFTGKIYQYMAGGNKLEAEIAVYNEGEFVRFTQVSNG